MALKKQIVDSVKSHLKWLGVRKAQSKKGRVTRFEQIVLYVIAAISVVDLAANWLPAFLLPGILLETAVETVFEQIQIALTVLVVIADYKITRDEKVVLALIAGLSVVDVFQNSIQVVPVLGPVLETISEAYLEYTQIALSVWLASKD